MIRKVVPAIALVLSAAAVMFFVQDRDGSSATASGGPASVPAVAQTMRAQVADLAILRAPDHLADAAEAKRISNALATGPAWTDTVDPQDVKLARSDDGVRVYVAKGTHSICLAIREADGSGSLNCETLLNAEQAEAATGKSGKIAAVDRLANGSYRVTGLVADDAGAPTISLASGKVADANVANNVYTEVVSDDPEQVLLAQEDGSVERLALPGQ
jgi:aspartate oxidase